MSFNEFDFTDEQMEQMTEQILTSIGGSIANIDDYMTSDDFTEKQKRRLQKQRDHLATLYQKYNGASYDAPKTDTDGSYT